MSAIKKHVKIGDCDLYLGDCLEVMPLLSVSHQPSQAGVVGQEEISILTDPPYGINRGGQAETFTKKAQHKRKHHELKEWDNYRPAKIIFDEMRRISNTQIIWGGELLR